MTKDKPTKKVGGTIQVCSICHQPTRLFEADHEECMNKEKETTTRAEIEEFIDLVDRYGNYCYSDFQDSDKVLLNDVEEALESLIAAAVREEREKAIQEYRLKLFKICEEGVDAIIANESVEGTMRQFATTLTNLIAEIDPFKEETEGEGEVE